MRLPAVARWRWRRARGGARLRSNLALVAATVWLPLGELDAMAAGAGALTEALKQVSTSGCLFAGPGVWSSWPTALVSPTGWRGAMADVSTGVAAVVVCVAVLVDVAVSVGFGVGGGVPVGVIVGVGVAVGVSVLVAVAVGVGVPVAVAVGVGVGGAPR